MTIENTVVCWTLVAWMALYNRPTVSSRDGLMLVTWRPDRRRSQSDGKDSQGALQGSNVWARSFLTTCALQTSLVGLLVEAPVTEKDLDFSDF